MDNGARIGNKGIYSNNGHPIHHHTSHTLENGASSSESGAYGDNEDLQGDGGIRYSCSRMANLLLSGRKQSGVLRSSLVKSTAELPNLTMNFPLHGSGKIDQGTVADACSPCSSPDGISREGNSSDGGGITMATSTSSSCSAFDFSIIESTLREGEQFATAYFDTAKKLKIAQALDDFGVEYVRSPT